MFTVTFEYKCMAKERNRSDFVLSPQRWKIGAINISPLHGDELCRESASPLLFTASFLLFLYAEMSNLR